MNQTKTSNYKELEKKIGIKFKDLDLVRTVFTHSSYVNEHKGEGIQNNERLEFLGDAVLELATTKHLFTKYPNQNEGDMTSFRSALVKGNHLAEISKELDLGKYLLLSNGEENSGGRTKKYILANVLEALIGAIYLDGGNAAAEKFIEKFILMRLDEIIEKGMHIDAKSLFQEICQEKKECTPYYELIKDEGPDHDKIFVMGVYVDEKLIAEGTGSSKQKAEDEAAKNALKKKEWQKK
ncbi:ribonuclease III [Candidatus Peregrinibacteria bacterium RIFCSPLOWO2_01_FULL_39_12]|nr:MAG: ribonuclease III [Candidatus Peregrinibacteria bacterium RIFCSPLOWO2_01_FULL_39_12]